MGLESSIQFSSRFDTMTGCARTSMCAKAVERRNFPIAKSCSMLACVYFGFHLTSMHSQVRTRQNECPTVVRYIASLYAMLSSPLQGSHVLLYQGRRDEFGDKVNSLCPTCDSKSKSRASQSSPQPNTMEAEEREQASSQESNQA